MASDSEKGSTCHVAIVDGGWWPFGENKQRQFFKNYA